MTIRSKISFQFCLPHEWSACGKSSECWFGIGWWAINRWNVILDPTCSWVAWNWWLRSSWTLSTFPFLRTAGPSPLNGSCGCRKLFSEVVPASTASPGRTSSTPSPYPTNQFPWKRTILQNTDVNRQISSKKKSPIFFLLLAEDADEFRWNRMRTAIQMRYMTLRPSHRKQSIIRICTKEIKIKFQWFFVISSVPVPNDGMAILWKHTRAIAGGWIRWLCYHRIVWPSKTLLISAINELNL